MKIKQSREPTTLWSHLHETSRIGRSKERPKKVDLWLPGVGRAWKNTEIDCKGGWVVFESQENALKLIVLMVVPLYEYTKNYRFVPLQQVSCVACELHLNKAVIKHTHTDTHI